MYNQYINGNILAGQEVEMKKKLLFLFIIVGVFVCLCSCGEKYTITFDPNGTEMETEQIKVEYEEFYALPIPHRVGYGFLGWYNGEEKIENTGYWNKEEGVHLVAKWEFLEFNIGCDLDSDGTYEKSLKYNSKTETFVIEAPIKEGHFFSHWLDSQGNKYEGDIEIPIGSEGDLYLTAIWWDFTYDDVIYEYDRNSLFVVGYQGKYKSNIEIPSELYNTPVVGIKKGAFEGAEEKTSSFGYAYRIYIPQSIKTIEENAFKDCKNVKVILVLEDNSLDYIEETEKWLEVVQINEKGNEHLVDVLLRRRPTIGASMYVPI